MQQKRQKEIGEAQKRFEESGGQKGEKTESKAGPIIRNVVLCGHAGDGCLFHNVAGEEVQRADLVFKP